LLSLLLHLLIVLVFFLAFKDVVIPVYQKSEEKITLNLQQFVPPTPKPVITPPKPVTLPTEPVMPITEPEPPVIPPIVEKTPSIMHESSPAPQKTLLDEKNRLSVKEKASEENNITQEVPPKTTQPEKVVKKEIKKKPKKVVKQKVVKKKKVTKKSKIKKPKKRVVKRKKQKRRKSKDPLADMLRNASTSKPSSRKRAPSIRMVRQFYGKEFNTFTPTQKKFIERNLGAIHRITQNTLSRNGYPYVAQRTQQQGTAIVSFYLHPNGDISGLRLKKRIGYASLDKNTLKVIRIAYKDYPRPKTKTKITFYVEYRLF